MELKNQKLLEDWNKEIIDDSKQNKKVVLKADLTQQVMTIKLQKNRYNWNVLLILTLLLVLTISMIFITICIFPAALRLHQSAILGLQVGWRLQENKIPEILLAGVGLSLGSYIIQQVTQNRLADTSIMGVSTVNIVVMVIIYTAGVGTTLVFQKIEPWVLMFSSTLVAILIFGLSYKKRQNISKKFVLAGIIINFLFVGFGNTFFNVGKANESIFLVSPYLDGQLPIPSLTSYQFYCALAIIVFAIIWLLIIAKPLFVANSNYLIAKSLGNNPTNLYFQSIVISALLTAGAFILVGNITFLGIATGNMAFFFFRKKITYGSISTILFGIFFMLFSFFIGNNVIANSYDPSSLIIPLIVAPIFIFLALKRK